MNPNGSFERPRLRTTVALACGLLFVGCGGAAADDITCKGIKQALVSANLSVMRIERSSKPVTQVQAAVAIGQMSALESAAGVACTQQDVDRIAAVVGPRLETLRRLLPVDDSETVAGDDGAGEPAAAASPADTAQDGADADGSSPPTPPDRPSSADRTRSGRGSYSATTCTRIYYNKDGHRRWRCKR